MNPAYVGKRLLGIVHDDLTSFGFSSGEGDDDVTYLTGVVLCPDHVYDLWLVDVVDVEPYIGGATVVSGCDKCNAHPK